MAGERAQGEHVGFSPDLRSMSELWGTMADDKNKILVVEDERTLVETLEYSLRRQGYEVFTAVSYTHLDVYKRQMMTLRNGFWVIAERSVSLISTNLFWCLP